ncbi:adenylosuccinate lyase [candidate division KSB1 bacterium]|nr:adenylosuccinate lyase [candidate division KSB1 bacterium]
MIARYTRPLMGSIWSDENRYRKWLDVEIAVCEVQADNGRIPAEAVEVIRNKADFNVDRIEAIEATVKHDVIAFLTSVAEFVGEEARFIHLGMTSSDLLDTALALLIREASAVLHEDLQELQAVLKKQAITHQQTVCIGRSHGIHAEPTSFGLKFVLWFDEMQRNLQRFDAAVEALRVGKISGAVGNFIHLEPKIEEQVCARLGLRPAPISTQIIQRDVHAQFLSTLALIGCSLEKMAVEIRHLQRTEVLEAEEPFTPGQKGSSAMPHKRNPIGSENISGLARLLRSNALAAQENIALWHERDISHSSVERIVFPDSCILADYMLARMTRLLEGLVVYPENMKRNLNLTHGLIFSQPVLLALTQKGMSREDAYRIVQTTAMICWQDGLDFQQALWKDEQVRSYLSRDELALCFDLNSGLKHVQEIYARVGIFD